LCASRVIFICFFLLAAELLGPFITFIFFFFRPAYFMTLLKAQGLIHLSGNCLWNKVHLASRLRCAHAIWFS